MINSSSSVIAPISIALSSIVSPPASIIDGLAPLENDILVYAFIGSFG